MTIIATTDGKEMRVANLFGYEMFFGYCTYCTWTSGRYPDRATASVITALHECDPTIDRCVHCGYEVLEDGNLYHLYNGLMACPTNQDYIAELVDGEEFADLEEVWDA